MRFFSGVSNYRETPYIISDTFANKGLYNPTTKGAIYIARDGASISEPSIFQANGTTWVPIGGYGIGTDATLQNVTDNGATSTDILKLTGADGIYVDVPNKQFSLGAGNFVNSDTQGFQMVDNTYKIGDIFNLHTKTKLAIDDDDLFIQANSDTFSVLNNANTLNIAKFALAEILLTDNSGATANTLRMYLGNVGIFTTNPTYKLDVHAVGNNSNQGIGIRNTNGGSSATASLFLGNNTGDNQARIFLNSTTNTANGGANSLNIGTVANSNLGFITNNVLKMLLDSVGSLAIGSGVPTTWALNVGGAAQSVIALYRSGAYFGYIGNANSTISGGTDGDLGLQSVGKFQITTGGLNTARLTIDTTGKTGFGTTAPTKLISIGTNASAPSNGLNILYITDEVASFTSNAATGEVRIGATNTIGTFFTTLYSNNAEALRLNSNGAVLIASATDNLSGAKLQVTGATTITAGLNVATSSGNVMIGSGSAGAPLSFADITGLKIQLNSNAANYYGIEKQNAVAGGDALIIIESGKTSPGEISFRSGGVSKLFIGAGGVITILNLAGTGSRAVLADANGVLSAPVSDISVKENIEPLNYGIAEIMALNPVSFEFIEGYKNYGEGKQIGNIAQDMYNVIPEAVFTTPSTGKMGINYDQLNGVYIKALQQLQEQIFELKAELNFLKNK